MTREFACFFQDALDGGGLCIESWKGHGQARSPKSCLISYIGQQEEVLR